MRVGPQGGLDGLRGRYHGRPGGGAEGMLALEMVSGLHTECSAQFDLFLSTLTSDQTAGCARSPLRPQILGRGSELFPAIDAQRGFAMLLSGLPQGSAHQPALTPLLMATAPLVGARSEPETRGRGQSLGKLPGEAGASLLHLPRTRRLLAWE